LFSGRNRKPQELKLKQLAELFKSYAELEERLIAALEFSQFDDMYWELKTEASAIEDILSKIADLTFLRTEDDYFGAFVTIRGEYHEDTMYLQEDSPDIRLEWKCIRTIANYLKTAFFSDIVYTSLEDYEDDVRQQEITLWVGESFAYGILKQLVGDYILIGSSRISLSIDVSPIKSLFESLPESEWGNYRIRVFRRRSASCLGAAYTDSALEIEHIPSKIKVRSNHERSQLQNRGIGMLFLMSRIYQASNEAKPKQALFSYTSGEKLLIDYPKKKIYSFTKSLALVKTIIEELETIPEF
jgi:hypothetical protein